MERIWGIYLNNLYHSDVGTLYHRAFPNGTRSSKIDRINELLRLDSLPKDEAIDKYLFGGKTSIRWIKPERQIDFDELRTTLSSEPLQCYERPVFPDLDESAQVVHALDHGGNIVVTFGTANFNRHLTVNNYSLKRSQSEYFAYVVVRPNTPDWIEIRTDSRLLLRILRALQSQLGVVIAGQNATADITWDRINAIKSRLPQARLTKYRGRSDDQNDITELLDMTARDGIDYASETEFQTQIASLEDINASVRFQFDGTENSIRIGLVTGSVVFQSYASEPLIDFVFDAFVATEGM